MEDRNRTAHRDGIGGRENPKRGVDQKIPLLGSAVKRKRLSDITNIVSSSRVASSSAQFQENPKEVACGITKDCITQLMEENATLLKALGERNKIIELSNIEMQKLRFTLEKANQRNRMLAQANSQMLAELTSSKERLKALQHELGCTIAVLRLKNSELDVKEKLNKELTEKMRIEEESLNRELCEKNTAEEEHPKCAEVAADALQFHTVDNNLACEPNRKRILRGLGAAATVTHQVEEGEKDTRRRSSRRRSNNVTSEAHESKDSLLQIVDAEIPSCSVITELPTEGNPVQEESSATVTHEVEAKEKEDTRRRKSSRRSDSLKSEPCEYKDHIPETTDIKNPTYSPITEPPNEDNPVQEETFGPNNSDASVKHDEDKAPLKDQSSTSQCPGQETCRTSVRRPTRKAAEKISSYKEVPLNVKMRRS